MRRRAFFNKLWSAAAIIALAPQIAFRPPKPKWIEDVWYEESCGSIAKAKISYLSSDQLNEIFKLPPTGLDVEGISWFSESQADSLCNFSHRRAS